MFAGATFYATAMTTDVVSGGVLDSRMCCRGTSRDGGVAGGCSKIWACLSWRGEAAGAGFTPARSHASIPAHKNRTWASMRAHGHGREDKSGLGCVDSLKPPVE